jgi:hypothetical protein
MLYVKSLYEARSIAFEENLGLMAAYSADRKALYYFLHPGRSTTTTKTAPEPVVEPVPAIDETDAVAQPEVEKDEALAFSAPFRLDNEEKASSTSGTDELTVNYLHEIMGKTLSFDLERDSESDVQKDETTATEQLPDKSKGKSGSERHDFSTWLHIFDEPQDEKVGQEALIEQFLQRNPQLRTKAQKEAPVVNLAKQSAVDKEEIITETLAKIYLNQGNVAKALSIYEKLSLRFPEKSSYFAAQIKILKQKLH